MNDKIIHRIFQYLDFKGIPHTRFEKDIGLSNGYLTTQKKRNADLGEKIIQKVINNSLQLSLEWLITGKGEMLKSNPDNVTLLEEERPVYNNHTIEALKQTVSAQQQTINALQEIIRLKDKGNKSNTDTPAGGMEGELKHTK